MLMPLLFCTASLLSVSYTSVNASAEGRSCVWSISAECQGLLPEGLETQAIDILQQPTLGHHTKGRATRVWARATHYTSQKALPVV